MESCGRSHDSAFITGEDSLVTLEIFRLGGAVDIPGKRRFPELIKGVLKLFVRTVEEESQRASARCGIVDYLGDHRVVFAEIELITDTYFTGRIDQNVPQTVYFVEFTEKKYFDFRTGFFFIPIKQGRKHARIVENEKVVFVEKIDNILEYTMFYRTVFAIYHHKTRLIAILCRILGNLFVGKFKLKLR